MFWGLLKWVGCMGTSYFFYFLVNETTIKTKHQAHFFVMPHKLRDEENTHYSKLKRLEE